MDTELVSLDEIAELNFSKVRDLWLFIDANTEKIQTQCNSEQKANLWALRDAARDAFFKAAASRLADNSVAIAELRRDLDEATKALKAELKSLQSIEAALKQLTKAVRFAGALVTFAAAF